MIRELYKEENFHLYFKENQINNELYKLNNLLGLNLNLGQLLSIPFVVFGVYLFLRNIKKDPFLS